MLGTEVEVAERELARGCRRLAVEEAADVVAPARVEHRGEPDREPGSLAVPLPGRGVVDVDQVGTRLARPGVQLGEQRPERRPDGGGAGGADLGRDVEQRSAAQPPDHDQPHLRQGPDDLGDGQAHPGADPPQQRGPPLDLARRSGVRRPTAWHGHQLVGVADPVGATLPAAGEG